MPLVYEELRRLAHYYLSRERSEHTLQSTALVHEAYLRLAGQDPPKWQNRAHFFGIAARIMRQVLMEYARSRGAAKRGGGACRVCVEPQDAAIATRRDVVAAAQPGGELDEQAPCAEEGPSAPEHRRTLPVEEWHSARACVAAGRLQAAYQQRCGHAPARRVATMRRWG